MAVDKVCDEHMKRDLAAYARVLTATLNTNCCVKGRLNPVSPIRSSTSGFMVSSTGKSSRKALHVWRPLTDSSSMSRTSPRTKPVPHLTGWRRISSSVHGWHIGAGSLTIQVDLCWRAVVVPRVCGTRSPRSTRPCSTLALLRAANPSGNARSGKQNVLGAITPGLPSGAEPLVRSAKMHRRTHITTQPKGAHPSRG